MIILLAVILLPAATAPNAAMDFVHPAFAVRVSRDVLYAWGPVNDSASSAKPLRLDLYEPFGDTALRREPAFVAIHGGGWTAGAKDDANIADLCVNLARRGHVCAAPDYRLLGDNPAAVGETPMKRAMTRRSETLKRPSRGLSPTHPNIASTRYALRSAAAGPAPSRRSMWPTSGRILTFARS
jgi:BD-FAE protein